MVQLGYDIQRRHHLEVLAAGTPAPVPLAMICLLAAARVGVTSSGVMAVPVAVAGDAAHQPCVLEEVEGAAEETLHRGSTCFNANRFCRSKNLALPADLAISRSGTVKPQLKLAGSTDDTARVLL